MLDRLVQHATSTAMWNIYNGMQRDAYDEPGRTAHEAIFNVNSGEFRCPNSQQGYSPFSTWTRGQAWAICGFAEQIEFLSFLRNETTNGLPPLLVDVLFANAACTTANHYLANCCADGIPMWDTGAPNLHRLGNFAGKVSDPYNKWEPLDSSAAAIAAQGLIRLGNHYLNSDVDVPKMLDELRERGRRYRQAGLTIAKSLFSEPYLSTDPKHQGLLLHSVYHRPNGWDYIAPGQSVPNGESSMWGDYHLRELALLILREARGEVYPTFFGCVA